MPGKKRAAQGVFHDLDRVTTDKVGLGVA